MRQSDFMLNPFVKRRDITLRFSCGARSASKLKEKKLLEKHAIAPSAARLCYASVDRATFADDSSMEYHQRGNKHNE